MTNEEFLAEKFCMSKYASMEDLIKSKADYLEQCIGWMEENLCDVLLTVNETIHINVMDLDGVEFAATGSCLLEAIENAQEEMNNV